MVGKAASVEVWGRPLPASERGNFIIDSIAPLGLGLWIGANILYAAALRRCTSISDLALRYLVFELVILTTCVHFLGGVEWIGVLFYGLVVGDASLVLPARRLYLVVTLAVFLYGGLAFLEYRGVIPHRPFFLPGLTLHQDVTWVILTVLAASGALTDRKSTRLNSSHIQKSRMPSSA